MEEKGEEGKERGKRGGKEGVEGNDCPVFLDNKVGNPNFGPIITF